MDYFRSDEGYESLTPDDCIEIFCTAPKGSSDLNLEMIAEIFADYNLTEEALLIGAVRDLLAACKGASATYDDRLANLEQEKDWRADDEYEDMVGHYTSLKRQVDAAIAKASPTPRGEGLGAIAPSA